MFYWFPSGSQSPINSNIASLSLIPILELNPHWRLIHRPISSQLPLHGTSLYTIVAIKMSKSSFLIAKQNTITDKSKVGFADCVAVTNNHHNHNSLFNTWQYYLVLSSLGQLLILTLNAAKQVVLQIFVEKRSFRVLSLSIIYEHSHGFPFDFRSWFLLFLSRSMRQSRLSWEYETSAWWAKQGEEEAEAQGLRSRRSWVTRCQLSLAACGYYRWHEHQTNFWICLSKYRYWITWITLWSINANLFLEKAACTELIHSPGISNGPPLTKACILGSTL